MKWKTVFLFAVSGSLLGPSAAWAQAQCDSAYGYLFMPTGQSFAVSGAFQLQPASNGSATFLIPSLDVSIPLGSRAVLKPMVGFCTPTEEGDSEVVFGGGGAVNFWNNSAETFALNLQGVATAYTFEGGSDVVIPLSVLGKWDASASGALVFGGGIQIDRFKFSGLERSNTTSDLFGTVGGMFTRGPAGFQAGLLVMDRALDTEIAVNAALTFGFN
jgi:hypothetical protein